MKQCLCSLVVLCLAGCGVIDDMRRLTTETRDEVRSSNNKIEQTKEAQLLGASYEVMISPHHSPNTRAGAAEVVFAKGDRTRLPVYVGALVRSLPLEVRPSVRWHVGERDVEVPNVTVVGNGRDTNNELNVPPVDPDLFSVLVAGTMQSLVKLRDSSELQAHLSAEQLEQMRSLAPRMVHIATTVLGAMTLENAIAIRRGNAVRAYLLDQRKREEGRDLLREIARNIPFTAPQVAEMNALIRMKLGLE